MLRLGHFTLAGLLALTGQYVHYQPNTGSTTCTPTTTNMLAGYFLDNSSCANANLTTVVDSSGNGNNLTAGTAGVCNTGVVNGHSALVFTGFGGASNFYTSTAEINCFTTCTVYAVLEQTTSTDAILFGSAFSTSVYSLQVSRSSDGKMEMDQQQTVAIALSTPATPLNTFIRIAASCSVSAGTATCAFYKSGSALALDQASASATLSHGIDRLGTNGAGNWFAGKIVALYFYSSAYSSTIDSCIATETGVS